MIHVLFKYLRLVTWDNQGNRFDFGGLSPRLRMLHELIIIKGLVTNLKSMSFRVSQVCPLGLVERVQSIMHFVHHSSVSITIFPSPIQLILSLPSLRSGLLEGYAHPHFGPCPGPFHRPSAHNCTISSQTSVSITLSTTSKPHFPASLETSPSRRR